MDDIMSLQRTIDSQANQVISLCRAGLEFCILMSEFIGIFIVGHLECTKSLCHSWNISRILQCIVVGCCFKFFSFFTSHFRIWLSFSCYLHCSWSAASARWSSKATKTRNCRSWTTRSSFTTRKRSDGWRMRRSLWVRCWVSDDVVCTVGKCSVWLGVCSKTLNNLCSIHMLCPRHCHLYHLDFNGCYMSLNTNRLESYFWYLLFCLMLDTKDAKIEQLNEARWGNIFYV